MNPWLKRLIFSNYHFSSTLLAIARSKNKKRAEQEMNTRLLRSLFDYEILSKPFPFYPVDIAIDNTLYGLSRSIKQYAGVNTQKRIGAFIEHGLFFGSYIQKDEFYTPGSHIFTFSNIREKWLKQGGVRKQIAKIGPMIHYAPPLYTNNTEQQEKIRAELGRILLFFPIHGDRYVSVTPEDSDLLISQIRESAKDFDSVLVSLYWHDALNPSNIEPYLNAGFHIVTSGHKFDPLFLSRQKFLIELSDRTLSNGAGTHVGYCIHLGKEHSILPAKVSMEYADDKLKKQLSFARTTENDRTQLEEMQEVEAAFTHPPSGIQEKHLEVTEKYWGHSYVRSPEQMRELLDSTKIK